MQNAICVSAPRMSPGRSGLLLLVFAPIDYVLSADTPQRRASMLIFVVLGAFLLGGALLAEYRRIRVD